MKKLRMVLLAGLLIAALCAPAHAWEFAMTGNFSGSTSIMLREGQNGFFGTQNVVNPALVAAGAPNWNVRISGWGPGSWVARNTAW